jgi:hypothetical protein
MYPVQQQAMYVTGSMDILTTLNCAHVCTAIRHQDLFTSAAILSMTLTMSSSTGRTMTELLPLPLCIQQTIMDA